MAFIVAGGITGLALGAIAGAALGYKMGTAAGWLFCSRLHQRTFTTPAPATT